eukprot:gene6387-7652_t
MPSQVANEVHYYGLLEELAVEEARASISEEAEVTLWMVLPGEWEASGALREGGVWALQPLAAVISQQRMAAACFMRPKLPFMNKLLGMPPAKHTKFALSDDEDDEDDEEVSDEGGEKGEEGEEGGEGGEAEETMSEEGEGPGAVEDRTQPAEATSDAAVEAVARAAEEAERGLNQSQQKALRMFLESSSGHLQLVQGPPGCGKTHFLAALLQGLRLKGVRTLVCAPSNKAVCVALDKFLASPGGRRTQCVLLGVESKLGAASGDAGFGARSDGETSTSQPTTTSAADVYVHALLERAAARLRGAVGRLRSCMAGTDGSPAGCGASGRFCSAAEMRFLVRVSHTEACQSRSRAMLGTVEAAAQELATLRWRLGGLVPGATEDAARLLTDAAEHLLQNGRGIPTDRAGPSIRGLEERDASALLGSHIEEGAVEAEALSHAQVVFCTLASAGQSLLRHMPRVDALVVDEAAQALEADVLIPLAATLPRRLLLVGDPQQLPATLISVEAQRRGRARSLMDHPYTMLDTQYRMHPAVAAFPAQMYYEGRLLNSLQVTQRASPWRAASLNAWTAPYAFVDVEGSELTGKGHPSMSNPKEAALDTHALCLTTQLCVITFYSAQGSECDVVICSFVRKNAQCRVGFVKDFQRLNVALTRARHSLIAVGHAQTL